MQGLRLADKALVDNIKKVETKPSELDWKGKATKTQVIKVSDEAAEDGGPYASSQPSQSQFSHMKALSTTMFKTSRAPHQAAVSKSQLSHVPRSDRWHKGRA